MNKISSLMFVSFLSMGTIITLSSASWIGAWLGLEINLLSFVPLMLSKNNMRSSEAAFKYFFTQASASIILLSFIILFSISSTSTLFSPSFCTEGVMSALMLKVGSAPFHFWLPNVMEGLSWINCFILMSWQKIAPLILSSFIFSQITQLFIISSALIGSIGGINQVLLRKLFAFSSINHIAWMISALSISTSLWIMYFLMYMILMIPIIFFFNKLKTFHFQQLWNFLSKSKINKIMFSLTLLSLGGLPPFLGFFPKWMVIMHLINYNLLISIILIMTSLITLFFYTRISFTSLTFLYSSSSEEGPKTFSNFSLMFILYSIASFALFIYLMS
uniref:NADH-ubiquinone oxidoreductase chain 2 n=1 Tax=Lepidocampa weberi TaxID=165470 RepID=U3KTP6_9HEXA|nr:NADH dehydrogenase subunit 2 [Lepidocampa weberi]AEV44873.1 NADH dehydrogenase subunit 2 [Lepidocampa weberi]